MPPDDINGLKEALRDCIEGFEGHIGPEFWDSPLGKRLEKWTPILWPKPDLAERVKDPWFGARVAALVAGMSVKCSCGRESHEHFIPESEDAEECCGFKIDLDSPWGHGDKARIVALESALWANIHGVGHDGPCWCMYIQVCHPPDDPQDHVELIDGHTKECWQARHVMADIIAAKNGEL